uniref:Uncharacterized protein n=1 Tax=Athene cunicularia TaxID=194338 RepID=A0A663LKD6_ATHCN
MPFLYLHSTRYDHRYPLLFSRSNRALICCKISIFPLFPNANSKYPVYPLLARTDHPKRPDWTCRWHRLTTASEDIYLPMHVQ